MSSVVKRIVSNSLFIWHMAGLIKEHVDVTVDECCLTQLFAKMRGMNRKRVPLLPSSSSSDAGKSLKICASAKAPGIERVREKNVYRDGSGSRIHRARVIPGVQCDNRLANEVKRDIEAMGQEPRRGEGYSIRQSACLVVETRRSETHIQI